MNIHSIYQLRIVFYHIVILGPIQMQKKQVQIWLNYCYYFFFLSVGSIDRSIELIKT